MSGKRILYISYFFPPINAIATYRALYQVKYLALNGYKIDVVCGIGGEAIDNGLMKEFAKYENIKVIRIKNFDFIRKIKKLFFGKKNKKFEMSKDERTIDRVIKKLYSKFIPSYTTFPDRVFIWLIKSYFIVKKRMTIYEYDLIYSSFGPPSSHILAYLLKNTKIKWFAEYRDLWSNSHINEQIKILKYFNKFIEKIIIKKSDLLVTVSKNLAKQLKKMYNKKIYIVYNGFEPHKIILNKKKNSKFKILYTGSIYKYKRDPGPLFKAVEILKNENIINKDNFEIKYYGPTPEIFFAKVQKFNILDLVNINGLISHEEILKEQFLADLLLLLEWNHPDAKGILTGKFFEYLYVKKPILFIGYKYSEINAILKYTDSGICLNDYIKIKTFIYSLINKKISFKFKNIERFSRENQTKKIINLIEKYS